MIQKNENEKKQKVSEKFKASQSWIIDFRKMDFKKSQEKSFLKRLNIRKHRGTRWEGNKKGKHGSEQHWLLKASQRQHTLFGSFYNLLMFINRSIKKKIYPHWIRHVILMVEMCKRLRLFEFVWPRPHGAFNKTWKKSWHYFCKQTLTAIV